MVSLPWRVIKGEETETDPSVVVSGGDVNVYYGSQAG